MYDIHCHILYDVDDGSDSLEESVKMVRFAYNSGTDAIVATPHCNVPDSYENYWGRELSEKVKRLRNAINEQNLPVKVFCGQEIFCTGRTPELLEAGKLITINNSRYALIEFDFHEYAASAYRKIYQLVSMGCVPIVAHPERYAFVSEEEDAVIKMKALGALIQMNKGSLSGGFGSQARHNAYRLLDQRLVDFVASDAHSPYMRTPDMSAAHEEVSEVFSFSYAQMIFEENPRLVIADKKVNTY